MIGRGPNAGGGIRRFEAASYVEAIARRISSLPGSARNTNENGSPGSGTFVATSNYSEAPAGPDRRSLPAETAYGDEPERPNGFRRGPSYRPGAAIREA